MAVSSHRSSEVSKHYISHPVDSVGIRKKVNSLFYQHHYLQGGRPFILDGFESPESAALRYEAAGYYEGGLLARADSPSRFPPMSAYGKPPPQLHGKPFDSYSQLLHEFHRWVSAF